MVGLTAYGVVASHLNVCVTQQFRLRLPFLDRVRWLGELSKGGCKRLSYGNFESGNLRAMERAGAKGRKKVKGTMGPCVNY